MMNYLTRFLQRKLDHVIAMHACKAFLNEAEKDPLGELVRSRDIQAYKKSLTLTPVVDGSAYNFTFYKKLSKLQTTILSRASIIGVLQQDYQQTHANGVAVISVVLEGEYVLTLRDGQIFNLRDRSNDDSVIRFSHPASVQQGMTLLGLSGSYLQLAEAVGTNILSGALHAEKISVKGSHESAPFYLLWQENGFDINWESNFQMMNTTFLKWASSLPGAYKLGHFTGAMKNEYLNQVLRMKARKVLSAL